MYQVPKKRNLRVYLSGAITNDENYKQKFYSKEQEIKSINPDLIIYNPAKIAHLDAFKIGWVEMMKLSLEVLAKCDIVYIFDDYKNSSGAKIELEAAKRLKKLIIFENENFKDWKNVLTYLQNKYNFEIM